MSRTSQNLTVHNLILVDESASMQSLHKVTVDSINDTINAIKNSSTATHQKVSLFTFNGAGIKMHMFNKSAADADFMTYEQFRPNSITPLLDCIGQSVGMVRTSLKSHTDEVRVMVTILTDGYENGSTKYCSKTIRELITHMRSLGWLFNYIGANHDVAKACESLNISNYYVFKKSAQELKKQMHLERMARIKLYEELNAIYPNEVRAA